MNRQTLIILLVIQTGFVTACGSVPEDESLPRPDLEIWAEKQRIANKLDRRRREARGLTEPAPLVPNIDELTQWENPAPGVAAACSLVQGGRACIGVNAEPKVVLVEIIPAVPVGDTVLVIVGGELFTTRVEQETGRAVWMGTEADEMAVLLSAERRALVSSVHGRTFSISLRGSSTAINRALR